MRRIVNFIFVFVVAFFFTACGGGGGGISPSDSNLPSAPVATFTSFSTSEDVNFTGTLTATDADTNLSNLSYSQVINPSHGTVLVDSNGSFTYSPTANYYGSDSFTYKVYDGSLYSSDKNVSITVTSVNDAPIISGTPNTYISKTSQYIFTPTVSDVDNNSFTYSITNKPSWADFNTSTGTLSGTPSAEGITTSINISVSDGNLSASLSPFNITVTTVNNTPVDINLSTYSVNENTTPEITISTEDNDSTVFVYSLAGGTDDANFTITGDKLTFKVAPNYEEKSLYSIKIQTKDDLNATFTKDFNITIVNQNDVATFTTIPTGTIIWQGESFNYVANIKDSDVGQTLTALTHTIPAGFDINAPVGNNTNDMNISVGSLQTGDNMVGNHNFILNVRENNTSATISQSFSVTIQDVNDAPTYSTKNDVNVSYGEPLILTYTIDDGDHIPSQIIDINATSSNPNIISITSITSSVTNSGGITLVLYGVEAGDSNITVNLKDRNGTVNSGHDTSSFTFKATVRSNGWKIYQEQKTSNYDGTKNNVTFDGINYTWNDANRWYENNVTDGGIILVPVQIIKDEHYASQNVIRYQEGHYYIKKNNLISDVRKVREHIPASDRYNVVSGSAIPANNAYFQHDPVHHLFVSRVIRNTLGDAYEQRTYAQWTDLNTSDGNSTNYMNAVDNNTSYTTAISMSSSYANTSVLIDSNNDGNITDSMCAKQYGEGWRLPTSYEMGMDISSGSNGYNGYIPAYVGDEAADIISSSKYDENNNWMLKSHNGFNNKFGSIIEQRRARCVYGIF